MYNIESNYLYEILEDYKCADAVDKEEILNTFMKLIWSSKNKRKVVIKEIGYTIPKSLADTETGKIFNEYSSISYTSYRSMCKDTGFVSLIRQKLNNIYTNLCDGRVCLKKEYMDLIKKPKQLYYRWISGETYYLSDLAHQLEHTLLEAQKTKEKYAMQKMAIEWNSYKTLVSSFFKCMFDNFISLDEFENKDHLTINADTWNEDNFAVAYLCKGLDGYMRNYQKKYYGLPDNSRKKYQRCVLCGTLIIINSKSDHCTKYCYSCKKLIKREKNRNYYNLSKSKNIQTP